MFGKKKRTLEDKAFDLYCAIKETIEDTLEHGDKDYAEIINLVLQQLTGEFFGVVASVDTDPKLIDELCESIKEKALEYKDKIVREENGHNHT